MSTTKRTLADWYISMVNDRPFEEITHNELVAINSRDRRMLIRIDELSDMAKSSSIVPAAQIKNIKENFEKACEIINDRMKRMAQVGCKMYEFTSGVSLPYGTVGSTYFIKEIPDDDLFVVNYYLDCNTPYGNIFEKYLTDAGFKFYYYVSLKIWWE
jgi:hypothetical protein